MKIGHLFLSIFQNLKRVSKNKNLGYYFGEMELKY
jgi:hypothetical protein